MGYGPSKPNLIKMAGNDGSNVVQRFCVFYKAFGF